MDLLCKPNKALWEKEKEDHIWSWKSTFVQKPVESLRDEKARVLCDSSLFAQDLARRKKEEARAKSSK